MGLGDILDRLSICHLKADRAGVDCLAEISELSNAFAPDERINACLGHLFLVNGAIWTLESDLRKGKEGELGLEEVGRRAIQIRNWNSLRVFLKNQINVEYSSGFPEIKKDHASAT